MMMASRVTTNHFNYIDEGKPVKGIAVFSSENDAVFKAALVKISDECK